MFLQLRRFRLKWLLAVLCAALFLLTAIFLEQIQPIDAFLYKHIASLRSPFADTFFQVFTSLAEPMVLLTLCFAIVFSIKRREYRVPLMLNLMLCILLNLGLKGFFARPRPTDVLVLVYASGHSFPSGHTMSAACFFGFLIFLVAPLKASRLVKTLYMSLLSIGILLIGVSRVYLGAHYFSDVFAGLCVSACYLIVYASLVEKYVRHPEHDTPKVVSGAADAVTVCIGTPDAGVPGACTPVTETVCANTLGTSTSGTGSPLHKSFAYAREGILAGLRSERNMVIHFGVMMIVVVFGAVFQLSAWEWIICILLFGLVFMAELLNTSIETIVDIIMPQRDHRAKIAKDTAAGAVLVIAIAAAVIGALIFAPKVLGLFG